MRHEGLLAPGPFKPEHLPNKSPYELNEGHPVECLPTRTRGGRAQLNGGLVIRTLPGVDAGVEVGVDLGQNTLRAPDVSLLAPGEGDDWAKKAPPLAIEYVDVGQDRADLRTKIRQLLAGGTRAVWAVRLTGPRRVEVYTADRAKPEVKGPGDLLTLEGVLPRPIPVEAFYDSDAADQVAMVNLLDRCGFKHPNVAFEEGRQEGRQEGREEGKLAALRSAAAILLRARGEASAEESVATMTEADLLALFARG
jgi:hypothetical protein